jgi:hypothetical protein
MELVTYNGGGMVAESKTVIIKDSSCSYIHWLPAKTDSLHFVLSQQELNDLLKKLNEFHFTGMSSSQAGGTVNDKPTTSIRFTRTEKTRKVSDSATERIKTGSESDFFKLFNYIGSLAENKTAANN